MEKVMRVATTTILSLELTAACDLWLMTYGLWLMVSQEGNADCGTHMAYISHFNMLGSRGESRR